MFLRDKMSSKLISNPNIPSLQQDVDQLKNKIEKLCFQDIPNLGTASPERLNVYDRARNLMNQLDLLRKRYEKLSIAEEGVSTRKFNRYKAEENHRLTNLKKQLEEIIQQLEPDEIEEDYFRRIKEDNPTEEIDDDADDFFNDEDFEDSNVENVDDIDDDEEGDTDTKFFNKEPNFKEMETEEKVQQKSDNIMFVVEALCDFEAEQDGDLDFKKGDQIAIIEQSDDGWWTGNDTNGNSGLVPSTLVKVVPSHIVKNEFKAPRKKSSGKDLWDKLKNSQSETSGNKYSVLDVLQAMKAVPSGFRSPTLGSFFQKVEYRTSSWIIPKTSSSNVNFKDLFWDPVNRKLRARNTNVCRTLSLVSARAIPLLKSGVQILSRHVYIALWDEEKILSNIHLVRGVYMERDNSWSFNLKIGKNPASLYDGDILVRSISDDRRLSVLLELNYTYLRTSTGEQSDISCGWGSVPLFELEGAPVPNKNFEIYLNGGNPFDRNIPVDLTLNEKPPQNLLQSLVRTNRQPRIYVKTTSYNRLSKESFDLLPDCIVTCQKYSQFIGYYRQHAASKFSKDDTIPSALVSDPVLSFFPRSFDYPDLMDALAIDWDLKTRVLMNRSQRKDYLHLQETFLRCFKETVLPLMHCKDLPTYRWGNGQSEQARTAFIQNYLQSVDLVSNLLSANQNFRPINISRMAFDVTSKFSNEPTPITREHIKS